MAFSFQVDANNDAQAILSKLQDRGNLPAAMAKIGTAVKLLVQNHFLALPANQRGWTSSGFWSAAAKSTSVTSSADYTIVTVAKQGVRQQLEGGPINPGAGKKFLTIAARSEAYGHRAGEFSNLVVRRMLNPFGHLQWALTDNVGRSTNIKFGKARKDGSRSVKAVSSNSGLVPYFWLTRHVDQKPNRGIIPMIEQINETVTATAQSYWLRLTQGGAAT